MPRDLLRWGKEDDDMLFHIAVVSVWIVATLCFYVAVALVCRTLRPSPLMVSVYAASRSFVSGRSRWRWYAFLFAGTIVLTTAALGVGIELSALGPVWMIGVAGVTCLAAAYSVMTFWPRAESLGRMRSVLVRGLGVAVAVACAGWYLYLLVEQRNWLTMAVGTYALTVPPLVWFRALRIRSAVCLLTAAAVYDAIHVFGTGWMDAFVDNIRDTPLVLHVPRSPKLVSADLFRICQGDILAPGMIMVVAGRAAERRRRSWLMLGTAVGAAIGFTLSTLIVFEIDRSLPALIVLVPCTCLGYGAAQLALRFRHPEESRDMREPAPAE